jgi:excisionase family DNA binding protein
MISQKETDRREVQSERDVKLHYERKRLGLDRACYSVTDTLHLLSISRTTLYELVKDGRLRIRKVGRKSLILAEDIASFLDTLEAA